MKIWVLQQVIDAVSLEGWSGASAKKVIQFPCIVSSDNKHQVFSLESNSKHNCRTKMDAASSDRPFFTPTKFSMPKLTCRDNFLQSFQCKSIHSFVRSSTNSFKRMEENMNFSWTTVFTTKLFFWQVCVCSAKGDTPWTSVFLFFLLFL